MDDQQIGTTKLTVIIAKTISLEYVIAVQVARQIKRDDNRESMHESKAHILELWRRRTTKISYLSVLSGAVVVPTLTSS